MNYTEFHFHNFVRLPCLCYARITALYKLLLLIYCYYYLCNIASSSDVRSEPLCFIQNNVNCTTRANLLTWLCGFYGVKEVLEAESVLLTVADSLKPSHKSDGMPRNISGRSGDGRRKAEAEDVLDLWAYLYSVKAPLPTFVAANLKRVPDTPVADTDICALMVNVLSLKNQLDVLMDRMATFIEL